MKRIKTGQKKHDEGVLKSAKYYKRLGYEVFADLPNYNRPKEIGKFIPDVVAKKGKREIIVEVETKKTLVSDKNQHKAFENYADRSENRKFRKKLV